MAKGSSVGDIVVLFCENEPCVLQIVEERTNEVVKVRVLTSCDDIDPCSFMNSSYLGRVGKILFHGKPTDKYLIKIKRSRTK